MGVFTIQNLNFSYPECREKAISNLSLTVEKGELLVLCGPSGCGKSTLLRQLKSVLAPHGERAGKILFEGNDLDLVSEEIQATRIGFVSQSPDNQIVTDKVWHELAFGLESIGMKTPVVRGRVAEMAAFFGIEDWFYKNVTELSGGQKQLLNLASVMVMQPTVLILDEPTSQLDPIASSDFLATLAKINRELGTTIVLTEHRLEEAFSLASRVAVMENGTIVCCDTPKKVGQFLKESGNAMSMALPTPMKIWMKLGNKNDCPITVAEGRSWLDNYTKNYEIKQVPPDKEYTYPDKAAVEAEGIWFRYERDGRDIIRGMNLSVKRGEFLAILGGNGAGKTTTLKIISGSKKPYRGSITVNGTIAALPQNPQALFVKKTVHEDLMEMFRGKHLSKEESESRIAYVTVLCKLENLLNRHPYDLSGGEQQRAALAKVLLLSPEILLLDEPTKGLDAEFKQEFSLIIERLLSDGVTVIMVSHDVEFCAAYAHRCALFFDGSIVTEGKPRNFFSGNSFYTTAANRMGRDVIPTAITADDIIMACGEEVNQQYRKKIDLPNIVFTENEKIQRSATLPLWRKLVALVAGSIAIAIFFQATGTADLSKLVSPNGMTAFGKDQIILYSVMICALIVFAIATYRRSEPPLCSQTPKDKRKLAKRTIIASVLILILIPVTLYVGVYYFDNRQYYITAFAVLLECMLPFFIVFEGRKPQARELVTIATLCAIGVAGRATFFMLPQFKPVAAITIISGIAFGGETGFLVGAMTMLTSNILFSQGPWTPFQMFAMGIIGFIAGVLFKKGFVRRLRSSMCIFGILSVIIIYGGIMNPASALMFGSETLNLKIILGYYVTGFPMDLIHGIATFLFLWFGAEPMLEKLDRIKVKYGLVE